MTPGRRRKIAVLTGGGDAPGLNAVIRAVAKSAFGKGWEVLGIEESGHDYFLQITDARPSRAPTTPLPTGASSMPTPFAARPDATRFTISGKFVVRSTNASPGRADAMTP